MNTIEKILAEIKRLIADPTLCPTTERRIGGLTALLKLHAFLDTLEEPDKDLEEEIVKVCDDFVFPLYGLDDEFGRELINKIARHFAEWQKSQMPMPEDTVLFQKGVEEGRRLEREDMLKDAVEGEVIKTNKHTSVRYKSYYGTDRYFYGIADKQFKAGNKVRIIILPKEEEK